MARKPASAKGATPTATRKGARPSGARQGKPTASARKSRQSPAVEAAQRATTRDLTQQAKPNDKFTPAQIIAALEASAGIRLGAAQTLRCSPSTITYYVDRYPEVKTALDEILENRLDIAEGIILKRMSDDQAKILQFNAAVFYLKTKGKHRGYVEGKELTGANGGAIKTENVGPVLDTSAMSDDELDALDTLLSKTVTLEADEYAEA